MARLAIAPAAATVPPPRAINRVGNDSDPDGDSEDRECHGQLECQH